MNRRNLIAAVVAMAAFTTACAPQAGARYKVPIAEARQMLLATEFPPQVFGGEPPVAEVRAEGDSAIVWIARRDDAELFRYVARLTPDGDAATRVSLELKGGSGEIAEKLSQNPKIRDLYLVAMTERIASALERRPYEMSRIYPAMTAATVANMGRLQASADEAAAASEKLERENIEKAYRDEAAGVRP